MRLVRTLIWPAAFALFLLLMTPWLRAHDSWRWSVATLATASTVDAATSWGHPELNPLMGPRFGARGVVIKAGALTGNVLFQRWAMRRWPWTRHLIVGLNYGGAALFAGVAIRNERLKR